MDDSNLVPIQPEAEPPQRGITISMGRVGIVGALMYRAALVAEHQLVHAQGSPDIIITSAGSLELADIKTTPVIPKQPTLTLDSLGGWQHMCHFTPTRVIQPHHNTKWPMAPKKKKHKRSVQKRSRKTNR